jgi:hypothetical protein
MLKKIIIVSAIAFFSNNLRSQTAFNPYTIVDGRMPIFDNLFTDLTPSPVLDNVITEAFYNQLFSERGNTFYSPQFPANPPYTNVAVSDVVMGKQVTNYKHFKAAVNYLYTKGGNYAKLFNEGSPEDIKRELAAVAAHAWQETKGFSFNSEQGYHPISDTYAYNGYHGRGPKQISYYYNYGSFNNFLFGANNVLMNDGKYRYPVDNIEYNIGPGPLAVDGRIAWLSAFWFYLTPQSPKPSMHNVIIAAPGTLIDGKPVGFGMTTLIINGGIECGHTVETQQSSNRIGYYNSFLSILGVTDTRQKTCNNLSQFSSSTITLDVNDTDLHIVSPILYPNPTTGTMKIKFSATQYKIVDIEVYDISGKLVLKKGKVASDEEFSIENLPDGNYVLKMIQNGNRVFSNLVTKK